MVHRCLPLSFETSRSASLWLPSPEDRGALGPPCSGWRFGGSRGMLPGSRTPPMQRRPGTERRADGDSLPSSANWSAPDARVHCRQSTDRRIGRTRAVFLAAFLSKLLSLFSATIDSFFVGQCPLLTVWYRATDFPFNTTVARTVVRFTAVAPGSGPLEHSVKLSLVVVHFNWCFRHGLLASRS